MQFLSHTAIFSVFHRHRWLMADNRTAQYRTLPSPQKAPLDSIIVGMTQVIQDWFHFVSQPGGASIVCYVGLLAALVLRFKPNISSKLLFS